MAHLQSTQTWGRPSAARETTKQILHKPRILGCRRSSKETRGFWQLHFGEPILFSFILGRFRCLLILDLCDIPVRCVSTKNRVGESPVRSSQDRVPFVGGAKGWTIPIVRNSRRIPQHATMEEWVGQPPVTFIFDLLIARNKRSGARAAPSMIRLGSPWRYCMTPTPRQPEKWNRWQKK